MPDFNTPHITFNDARFVGSVAGASAINFAYVGEFYPAKARSQAIMYMSTVASVVVILMPGLGWILSTLDFEWVITENYVVSPWRLQLLFPSIPFIIALVVIKTLPESPKFLVSVHDETGALLVLGRIFEANTGKKRHELPIKRLDGMPLETEEQYNRKTIRGFCLSLMHETAILFRPPLLRLILSVCFIQFGIFLM